MSKPKSYHSTNEIYSAPLAIPLTHESGWGGSGSPYGPFQVVRFNFILQRKPLPGISYGDAIAHLEAPKGADFTDRRLLKYEYETVTTAGMLEEQIVTADVVSRIRADATATAPNLATFSLGAELESHIASAFRQNHTFETRDGKKTTVEREVSFTVTGGTPASVYAVPYRRESMSVRLSHIDYLTVTYRPRFAGLRIERTKEPAFREAALGGHQTSANFRKSGLLLGKFMYWIPVGDASTTLVTKSRHFDSHINPSHVEFVAAPGEDRKVYDLSDFRGTPSLYKIANAAFPLKKTQRDSAWTNSELLEQLDVEPEDAVFIWEAHRRWRRRPIGDK